MNKRTGNLIQYISMLLICSIQTVTPGMKWFKEEVCASGWSDLGNR